ncbi:MAG: sensor domain-containing protein [Halobacteriota archaeon]
MTQTTPRSMVGSFLRTPIDPQTYRSLLYVLVAFPVAVLYLLVLTIGGSLSIGLSVTLFGPLVFIATLLFVVAFAWGDGKLTGELLNVPVTPALPSADGGVVEFLTQLVFGQQTWAGVVYLVWRVCFGFVALFVVTIGGSIALDLAMSPLYYDATLGVYPYTDVLVIDTFGRSIAASLIGVVVAFVTLWVVKLLGTLSGVVAATLLDTDGVDGSADVESDV